MSVEFGQSGIEQIDAIIELLRHSFHVSTDAPSLDRSYLTWKYYATGPVWPGSRSLVLTDGSQIVAHAAITPVQLRLADGVRDGIGFEDWVSSEAHRGAGLMLLRKLMTLSRFVLVTGGAPITRQILPRAGFVPWAERRRYIRILRPLRQLQTRGTTLGWKEPLRLARNTAWSMRPLSPAQQWTAVPSSPEDAVLSVVEGQQGSVHTVASLQYWLRCPTIRFQFLVLRRAGKTMGYSVLSFAGGQARLAELRIASELQKDWNAAVAAVLGSLQSDKKTCEVMALGSVPTLNNALEANGFIGREHLPLVVYDPAGKMADQPVPQLGLLGG